MSENTLDGLGGIASLLQNPEISSKLPRIMEALAPVMAEMRAEDGKAETQSSAEPPAAAENAIASLVGGRKNDERSRRYALLHALEPYLSKPRRDAMEYILRVASLIDILSEVM